MPSQVSASLAGIPIRRINRRNFNSLDRETRSFT
jgi:hypothetical protein